MIIDAREDVVALSGNLDRNLWPAIQAPANLLLRQHPTGILIDASELHMCTTEGVKTFVDAVQYIERYRARIVLCNVPQEVADMIRTVPGARSQVAIAPDRESGRASLELAQRQREKKRIKLAAELEDRQILVPLIPSMSTTREALGLSKVLAGVADTANVAEAKEPPRGKKPSSLIHLAFFIEVPRSMPLSAPFAEEEDHARRLLNEAESIAAKIGLRVKSHIIRSRNTAEEIIEQATILNINTIVLSLPAASEVGREPVQNIVRHVLERAHCEVLIKRIADHSEIA
jgi:anti-anti-sigma regulatory factor/nucleotide-binding universal stress UspA family protein